MLQPDTLNCKPSSPQKPSTPCGVTGTHTTPSVFHSCQLLCDLTHPPNHTPSLPWPTVPPPTCSALASWSA